MSKKEITSFIEHLRINICIFQSIILNIHKSVLMSAFFKALCAVRPLAFFVLLSSFIQSVRFNDTNDFVMLGKGRRIKTGVVNDPLSKSHSPDSRDYGVILKIGNVRNCTYTRQHMSK